MRKIDYTGQRFGSFTVIREYEEKEPRYVRWVIRCDCGFERIIRAGNLRNGHGTQSCPQKHVLRTHPHQLPDGEAALNALFNNYQQKAKKRGIEFLLNRQEFGVITKQPCAYCGEEPGQVKKNTTGSPYVYNGVDRIDSREGYTTKNCVPCCKRCNFSKSDMTLGEWREHIKRLYERMTLHE